MCCRGLGLLSHRLGGVQLGLAGAGGGNSETPHASVSLSAAWSGHLGLIAARLGEPLGPVRWFSGSPCSSGSLTLPLTATPSPPQGGCHPLSSESPCSRPPLSHHRNPFPVPETSALAFVPPASQLPPVSLPSPASWPPGAPASAALEVPRLPRIPFFPLGLRFSHSEFKAHSLVCRWRQSAHLVLLPQSRSAPGLAFAPSGPVLRPLWPGCPRLVMRLGKVTKRREKATRMQCSRRRGGREVAAV